MFEAAKRFVLVQKIKELEKAIGHWPDSPKLVDRQIELREKKIELERLDGKEI